MVCSLNASVSLPVAMFGAMNRACWVAAPVRMTDVPAVCVHSQLEIPLSWSEPVPFRITAAPALTVWSGPALAFGAWFWEMVIVLPAELMMSSFLRSTMLT